MKLRNIFMTAIACSVLVLASGDTSSNGMGGDTSGNDGSNGGMTDTMMTMGTIMELNTTDGMLILQTDTSTDTFYITSNTQMPTEQELTAGTRVRVRYIEMQERKELVSVEPQNAQGASFHKTSYKMTAGDNGSNGEGEKITGTIQQINPTDSMLIVKSDDEIDTIYFNENTEMSIDQLRPNTEVKIWYEEKDDRKVANKIKVGGENGQKSNGQKDTSTME